MTKSLYQILPDGRWLFHFDNHMISSFTTCEQLFEYSHVRNIRRKGGTSFITAIGLWWSDVMADFYESLRTEHMLAETDIVISAVRHWDKLQMNRFKQIVPEKFEKFAISEIAIPIEVAGAPICVPLGAVKMATEFYKHRASSDQRHWKIIAVENPFGTDEDLIIGEDARVIVSYEGRPDIFVRDAQDRLMPVDNKTKDYPDPAILISEYKPHPQTAGYIFAANLMAQRLGFTNCIVDRCTILVAGRFPPATPRDKSKLPKPRFVQITINYSQSELLEWKHQLIRKAARLRYAIEHNDWIMKESSCHYQYGSPCAFREICNKPPEIRERMISSDYEITKPWYTDYAEDRNEVKQ